VAWTLEWVRWNVCTFPLDEERVHVHVYIFHALSPSLSMINWDRCELTHEREREC